MRWPVSGAWSADFLRGEFYGGLTAAVVALPVALAFGVASGLGPAAGLYGAILTGFFTAVFGGTPGQISAPSGPMTVIMAVVVTQFAGQPGLAFSAVILAGLLQIGFGAAKLGRYISLIPYPVISGILSGVGLIIILLQLAPVLGTPVLAKHLWILARLPTMLQEINPQALLAALITVVVAVFLPNRIRRFLPATLAALIVGTLAGLLLLPEAPDLGQIPDGLPRLQLPELSLVDLPAVLKAALALAFLGSVDSLLTSVIVDGVRGSQHDSDRELRGQGLGNIAAGFFGALPGAGTTVCTIVNVRAGGGSRLSAMVHSVMLLAIVLGASGLVSHIPQAVLGAILLKTGWELIDKNYLRQLRHTPRAEVLLMVTVLLLTLFVDVIAALAVGVIAASLIFVNRMAELELEGLEPITEPTPASGFSDEENILLAEAKGRVLLVRLAGPLSFGAANGMVRRLGNVGGCEALVLDFSDCSYLDGSAAIAIEAIVRRAESSGHRVLMVGLSAAIAKVLNPTGALKDLQSGSRFRSRLKALRYALSLLTPAAEDDAEGTPS